MLRIEGLGVSYGGLRALAGVSLEVGVGQFVAVVGPNGAGKTTLFKTISGTVAPDAGRIAFEGRDLLALGPAERPHLGIAHVPEGRKVFGAMTVLENLEMGATTKAGQARWKANLERIYALFPVLAERRGQYAGTLSGGQQQMLAIGRGMASAPKLLMLDEPSMGLAPLIVEQVMRVISEIRDQGTTVLLVEQNARAALKITDRAYVIEGGVTTIEGRATDLINDPRIIDAYLGA